MRMYVLYVYIWETKVWHGLPGNLPSVLFCMQIFYSAVLLLQFPSMNFQAHGNPGCRQYMHYDVSPFPHSVFSEWIIYSAIPRVRQPAKPPPSPNHKDTKIIPVLRVGNSVSNRKCDPKPNSCSRWIVIFSPGKYSPCWARCRQESWSIGRTRRHCTTAVGWADEEGKEEESQWPFEAW